MRWALREEGSGLSWVGYFTVTLIKHPDKSNVRKEGVTSPQNSRVQFTMMEKSWQQDQRQLVALYLYFCQYVERDECCSSVHILCMDGIVLPTISPL